MSNYDTAILGATIFGVLAALGLGQWLRAVALQRAARMRGFGFRPAPEVRSEILKEVRTFSVFEEAEKCVIERDRVFRAAFDGLDIWYFDYSRDFGDAFYPRANVVAPRRVLLNMHVMASETAPRDAWRGANEWKVAATNDCVFCWRPSQTVGDDPAAFASFIQRASQELMALGERLNEALK